MNETNKRREEEKGDLGKKGKKRIGSLFLQNSFFYFLVVTRKAVGTFRLTTHKVRVNATLTLKKI